MRSIRYFSLAAVALVVLVVAAVPAAAVSVEASGVPSAAESGTTVGVDEDITFDVTDLYSRYDSFTLAGTTGLESATWTVTLYDNQGNQIRQTSPTGNNFSVAIDGEADRVEVRVEGDVPGPDAYSAQYDPPQQFLLASFAQSQDGGVSSPIGDQYEVRPYTEESQTARNALDDAATAIDDAGASGGDVSTAEETFQSAESAYDAENFDNAVELADRAQSEAESAAQSASTMDLLVTAGGALVVLLLLGGGGFLYYRRRQGSNKLS